LAEIVDVADLPSLTGREPLSRSTGPLHEPIEARGGTPIRTDGLDRARFTGATPVGRHSRTGRQLTDLGDVAGSVAELPFRYYGPET
jgi:hypothetical protein